MQVEKIVKPETAHPGKGVVLRLPAAAVCLCAWRFPGRLGGTWRAVAFGRDRGGRGRIPMESGIPDFDGRNGIRIGHLHIFTAQGNPNAVREELRQACMVLLNGL
jgi:hypothetical protein